MLLAQMTVELGCPKPPGPGGRLEVLGKSDVAVSSLKVENSGRLSGGRSPSFSEDHSLLPRKTLTDWMRLPTFWRMI